MLVFEKYNMWCKPKAVKTVTTDFKTDFTSKFHNLTSQPLLKKFLPSCFIYLCVPIQTAVATWNFMYFHDFL